MIYIAVLLLIFNLQQLNGSFSGLYVDNGDQTIIERKMTKRQTLRLGRGLSNIFGLPEKSKRPRRFVAANSSAPTFLKDMYEFLEGAKSEDNIYELTNDFQAAKDSDAIMSFLIQDNFVHSMRHERGKRIYFNLSTAPVDNMVLSSELRIFKFRKPAAEQFIVKVFEVIMDYDGSKEIKFIDETNVTNDFDGWLVFNVTSSFNDWTTFPLRNRGLYVSLHKQLRSEHEVNVDEAGIILSTTEEPEYQPFLVAFLKNSNKPKSRYTREVKQNTKNKNNNSDVEAESSAALSNPFTDLPALSWSHRICQIQIMYVDFKELDWHEWVVAPKGYAAYYCGGSCEFPLSNHMNATNHAVVQTLVNFLEPDAAPKPCCAPTKLGTLSLMHFMADGSVILKKFRNMVVLSCGCH